MSVSPPGQRRRKARDLNPHGLSAARFSKPARQPVSGYPPYRVDPAGVEPALPARQAGVVPLDHRPMQPVRGVGVEPTLSGSQGRRITAFLPPARVDRRGIAPRFPPCDGGVFLLDEQPHRGPAGGRTRSSALTRAACGRNTSRPSSCGGRIRTGVGRLMRPCWQPGSSPLRSTPGRTRTCARLHVREVPWPLGYGGRRQ
jgi:hypothetical protein